MLSSSFVVVGNLGFYIVIHNNIRHILAQMLHNNIGSHIDLENLGHPKASPKG